MAFSPIAFTLPQYENYPNWWMKAYAQGTTTPLSIATDATGGTLAAKIELNVDGFPVTAGAVRFIPFINGDYDLWLFPTAADADANDTTNAIQLADNINADKSPATIGATTVVDNISALVATSPDAGVVYETKGYTTPGDGGQAAYLIKTAAQAATDGDVIDGYGNHTLANGNVSILQANTINILQFGASEAAASNHLPVQAAIDYALTSLKPIYVPTGTYVFTTGLVVDGETADRFTLFSDEIRSAAFTTTSAITVLALNGTPANTFQYPNIRNMTFSAGNASAIGVATKNTEFLRITDCVFTGSGKGISMSETGGDSDIKPNIWRCLFGGALAHGIFGGDTRQADGSYKDNLFIDCTSSCITLGWPDGATITGNKMFNNGAGATAINGFRLKKPIYCIVEDNDFFELGGTGLILTSPRYSRFNNNRFINVGQSGPFDAVTVTDFDGSTPGVDVQFIGNTFKDCNGAGIVISSAASIQTRYTIEDNYFEDVGDAGVIYDAIALTNCSDFEIRRNQFDSNEVTNKTRYWLSLTGSTDIKIQGNQHDNMINPDVFRSGTCSMIVEDSRRIYNDVTATQTMLFDDDGVIGGTLTSSITLNLPAANACPGKKFDCIWTAGAFSIILDPAASQTIDGASTLNVNSGNPRATIVSNGANWFTL